MPKSKYKYYKSSGLGCIYRAHAENHCYIVEACGGNRHGWQVVDNNILKEINNHRLLPITEYQALHADMFGEDL